MNNISITKIILFIIFFMVTISFLNSSENKNNEVKFLFFCVEENNCDMNGILLNTKLKKYIKVKSNQFIKITQDNNWLFQIKNETTRLTFSFSTKKTKKIVLFVNFQTKSIINLSNDYDKIIVLHESIINNVKSILENNNNFFKEVDLYNPNSDIIIKISHYKEKITQLKNLLNIFSKTWNLLELKNEEEKITKLIKILLKEKETILLLSKENYNKQLIQKMQVYVIQTQKTNKFDNYLEEVIKIQKYFEKINDEKKFEQALQYKQKIIELKDKYKKNMMEKLSMIKIYPDIKYSQINSNIKILDSYKNEITLTQSKFPDLINQITQLKTLLLHKKSVFLKDYYERNKEKIFKYSMYSIASVSVSISTISLGLGIASFALRGYYIDTFNVARTAYDKATTMEEIYNYKSIMQDSVTNANNYYRLALVTLPVSSVFLVAGVFLYFVDKIIKKIKQKINSKKSVQNSYIFGFKLNGEFKKEQATIYFGFRL